MLLAYEKGAELIVAVGTHFNLIEFLERNRDGMSSTFITRLRVGEILVDAKGVSRLVSRRTSGRAARRARRSPGSPRSSTAVAASPALRHLIELLVLDIARRARSVRAEAERELLAARADVWAFLAEPYHLADWWPGIPRVEPDRRGFAPGARWQVRGTRWVNPFVGRRPSDQLLLVREIDEYERWASTSTPSSSTSRCGSARSRPTGRSSGSPSRARGSSGAPDAGAEARSSVCTRSCRPPRTRVPRCPTPSS